MSRVTTIPFIVISLLAVSLTACSDSTTFTPIAEAATIEGGSASSELADDIYLPTIK